MNITQLVDRFGSNRMNASEPGKLLRGCTCVNITFAGGMCEVPFILSPRSGGDPESQGTANIVNVNDLDRHVINLCEMIRSYREELCRQWDATPFHPDVLTLAQQKCKMYSLNNWRENTLGTDAARIDWAYHYFIASWMGRGGRGGTKGEFDGGLSVRWKSTGGDSCKRFQSATEALAEWQTVMRRCTFHCMDAFDFIAECSKRDIPENGIYCDPPWPDDGDKYTHVFEESHQVHLSLVLGAFEKTRIVVRLNDHQLVRDLYPEPAWTWHRLESRTQANEAKQEVLLTRNI